MGYTHYWRHGKLDEMRFGAFAVAAGKILVKAIEGGLPLAGPMGTGVPEFGFDAVAFNGDEHCGHSENGISIPWPSRTAVGGFVKDGALAVAGNWFAGTSLETRACNGDCSYETFSIAREGTGFDCCKTAYRPYDIAVTAVLLTFKHYFPNEVEISSDGDRKDWLDGQNLVHVALGFTPEIPLSE